MLLNYISISGITNFDLLGSFGKMKWLGNFYIVLLYNAIFAFSASLSLFNKLTSRVRQEIVSRYVCQLDFSEAINKPVTRIYPHFKINTGLPLLLHIYIMYSIVAGYPAIFQLCSLGGSIQLMTV